MCPLISYATVIILIILKLDVQFNHFHFQVCDFLYPQLSKYNYSLTSPHPQFSSDPLFKRSNHNNSSIFIPLKKTRIKRVLNYQSLHTLNNNIVHQSTMSNSSNYRTPTNFVAPPEIIEN